MKENKGLIKELSDLSASSFYPMHMPGHKRVPLSGLLPYDIDITEIDGFDDLHHPTGILKKAMERTAGLFLAKKSYYLVNGSSLGILASITALTDYGDTVIAARNCHLSVFHAIQLRGLKAFYVMPGYDREQGILTGVSVKAVEEALKKAENARAVIITSPTYEGMTSDIEAIARICHESGKPLIVDEAHGAHLIFYRGLSAEGFRSSAAREALNSGADIVVQSTHKTLFSLTQTALLHLGEGGLKYSEKIEEALSLFETSSPSYPLMASISECTEFLYDKGRELFRLYEERLLRFCRETSGLERLKVVSFYGDKDPGKLLISSSGGEMSGFEIAGLLRKKYRIETEYSDEKTVLAMTTAADTDDGFFRLSKALKEMDGMRQEDERDKESVICGPSGKDPAFLKLKQEAALSIAEALNKEICAVPFSEAVGRISAEYISLYPPGIPLLIPGEVIDKETLDLISGTGLKDRRIRRSKKSAGPLEICVIS